MFFYKAICIFCQGAVLSSDVALTDLWDLQWFLKQSQKWHVLLTLFNTPTYIHSSLASKHATPLSLVKLDGLYFHLYEFGDDFYPQTSWQMTISSEYYTVLKYLRIGIHDFYHIYIYTYIYIYEYMYIHIDIGAPKSTAPIAATHTTNVIIIYHYFRNLTGKIRQSEWRH